MSVQAASENPRHTAQVATGPARCPSVKLSVSARVRNATPTRMATPATMTTSEVRRSGTGSRWMTVMNMVHSGFVKPSTRSAPGNHTSPLPEAKVRAYVMEIMASSNRTKWRFPSTQNRPSATTQDHSATPTRIGAVREAQSHCTTRAGRVSTVVGTPRSSATFSATLISRHLSRIRHTARHDCGSRTDAQTLDAADRRPACRPTMHPERRDDWLNDAGPQGMPRALWVCTESRQRGSARQCSMARRVLVAVTCGSESSMGCSRWCSAGKPTQRSGSAPT